MNKGGSLELLSLGLYFGDDGCIFPRVPSAISVTKVLQSKTTIILDKARSLACTLSSRKEEILVLGGRWCP
jgi:hypothetical protein